MMNNFTFFICFIFCIPAAYSQETDTLWTRVMGGPGEDWSRSMAIDNDDNIILAGISSQTGGYINQNKGLKDTWVIKLNSTGDTLWSKSYGGSDNDYGQAVATNANREIFVVSESKSYDGDVGSNNGSSDFWILKLDPMGEIAWSVTLGGASMDMPRSITTTHDGGCLVAGSHENIESGTGEDYYIVKLDSLGQMEWESLIGGYGLDRAYSVVEYSMNQIFVTGFSNSNIDGNYGSYDSWVVKLDSAGNYLWSNNYGGSQSDASFNIEKYGDDLIVVGYSQSSNFHLEENMGSHDVWVYKIDTTGNLIWSNSFGGSGSDMAYNLCPTVSGESYMISGKSESTDGDVIGNHGDFDYWMLEVSSSGYLIWNYCFGGESTDMGQDVALTDEGIYIVAGRYSSVDGSVHPNQGGWDTWLLNIEAVVTQVESIKTKSEHYLSQNYPNPSQNKTTIEYYLASDTFVVLELFDINGRACNTLISENQTTGLYSVDLNTSQLTTGIYFYRIKTSNMRSQWYDTKALIVR